MQNKINTNIDFPDNLPVAQRIEDIKEAINNNSVTIVCGETGSGKTTQLPKICLMIVKMKNPITKAPAIGKPTSEISVKTSSISYYKQHLQLKKLRHQLMYQ